MEVQLTDGRRVRFPDGMSREEMEAALRELPEKASPLKEGAKTIASGVVDAAIGGTVGLPGELQNLSQQVQQAFPRTPPFFNVGAHLPFNLPDTQDITSALGIDYQPPTPGGQLAKAAAGGAAGMFIPPTGGASALVRAMIGGAAGAGGEKVAQTVDSGAAGMATQGGLLGALGLYYARKPRLAKTVGAELENIGKPALREAGVRAGDIETKTGVRPLLSQATSDPTQLSGITREVAASGAGGKIDNILNQQSRYGNEKIDQAYREASVLEPGQDTANRVLAAGDKALDRPGRVAQAVSNRLYRQAGDERLPGGREKAGTVQAVKDGRTGEYFVPQTTALDLAQRIVDRKKSLNLRLVPAGRAMDEAASMLRQLSGNKAGIPVKELDTYRRSLQDRISAIENKTTIESGEVAKLQGYKAVAGLFNDALKETAPALAEGKSRFALTARTQQAQMDRSAMPDLFTDSARQTGRGNFDEMGKVIRDSSSYSPKDIAFVAEQLRRADPEAFPALVRREWEAAATEARAPQAGRTPQQAMNAWVQQVAGGSTTRVRANYLETVRQVAKSQGKDPEAAAKGANELAETLLVFSRDREALGLVDAGEMARTAGRSAVATGMRSLSPVPLWGASRALERQLHKSTYRKLTDALTSPEGVDKLIEIANYSRPRELSREMLRAMFSAYGVDVGRDE